MTLSREVCATALRWLRSGRRIVAATLISSDGSAPFDPGATMLVDTEGRTEGSVTGGCVEAALFEEAQDVLRGGDARVRTYGISDADAAGVGLMCGGVVDIFVHELRAEDDATLDAVVTGLNEGIDTVIATVLDGSKPGKKIALVGERLIGSFELGERFDSAIERELSGSSRQGGTMIRRLGPGGEVLGDEVGVFVQSFAAPPHMVIFGAVDYAVAVARIAKTLGYRVTICDARRTFVESDRFHVAAEVAVDWPDQYLERQSVGERDVVLVFTHDPKFDEPALRAALATEAGYIGALGSRRTHAVRVQRLLDGGVDRQDLARIAAPCGLDIGARTPEETAVSVLAEVIARASGRQGGPLSEGEGSIRSTPAAVSELA